MTGVVLLTGACGFVGHQVLRALAESGVQVRAVVRDGKQGNLAALEVIETVVPTPDLFAESADWWADVCKGVDTVIHVAWYAKHGEYLQSPKNFDCLAGTLNLSKGAILANVRRFVGIGTCIEYDLSDGVLSVDTPLKPLTPYAGAKAATFMALSQWLPLQNVEFAWCRLFYLYGEGEDARRLVPYLRTKLGAGEPVELTSGTQIRDFLDVCEAGRMVVEVALGNEQGAVNICSGIPVKVRELAEQVADEYGRRDLLRFGMLSNELAESPCVVGVRSRLS
jgi:nucleoside-diphosphate-sugar epimerase